MIREDKHRSSGALDSKIDGPRGYRQPRGPSSMSPVSRTAHETLIVVPRRDLGRGPDEDLHYDPQRDLHHDPLR